jgi:peptidoglycan/xylan/chitin deacetylase (PgdA/CDA1 family)
MAASGRRGISCGIGVSAIGTGRTVRDGTVKDGTVRDGTVKDGSVKGLAVKSLAVAGLAVAGLAVAQAGPGITGLGPVRRSLFPRLAGEGDLGHVALTFDDGPDPGATPEFAAVLAERQVTATFFLLGEMVARAPSLAADIAAAGHEIGVHGWEHRYMPWRGPRVAADDLRRATELIASVTGTRPRLLRPPYGVLSGSALIAARSLGLTPVLWGTWGREWAPGATPASVYAQLTARLHGGVTVLLHDSDCTSPLGSWRAALGALPLLLDECDRRGLAVGPLSEHGLEYVGGSDRTYQDQPRPNH